MGSKDAMKPVECPQCEKSFSATQISKHMRGVHFKFKPYQCDACEYKCHELGNLKQHVHNIHLPIKQFKCSECNFVTSNPTSLRIHEKGHQNQGVQCPVCEVKLSSKYHLNVHVKHVTTLVRKLVTFVTKMLET